jgi:hypothetical protein
MSNRTLNRKYPPKQCPGCKKTYIPTDVRQIYCIPQCRINFNNDNRKLKEAPAQLLKKKLFQNERILKHAYDWLNFYSKGDIALDFLLFNGFEPKIFSEQSINQDIGTRVYWSFQYGIEGIQRDNKLVKILKK